MNAASLNAAPVGGVVWYVTGRFYAAGSTLRDVGYVLHLQGVESPLFTGEISEATALVTFAAEPFTSPSIANGSMNIGIDRRGLFRLYLRETPGATFDDPASFATGTCIGVFERVAMVPTVNVAVSTAVTMLANVFTARLVASEPFTLDGRRYNLRALAGNGITQWGTAATEPLQPPPGYDAAVPFVGSAIRIANP